MTTNHRQLSWHVVAEPHEQRGNEGMSNRATRKSNTLRPLTQPPAPPLPGISLTQKRKVTYIIDIGKLVIAAALFS